MSAKKAGYLSSSVAFGWALLYKSIGRLSVLIDARKGGR